MKHITFYLDFVSPYAYLAFERLPQELAGLSFAITYQPILLGAVLQHHGNRAPADVAPKREWLYRHVSWLGQQQGLDFSMPRVHPFNPLPLLRLALACDAAGTPNRHVCTQIFRHVWQGGEDAADPARLATLQAALKPAREPGDAEVKQQLRTVTDDAARAGVFGVPAFAVDGKLFWGLDALPMLRAYLAGDAWFDSPAWAEAAQVPKA
jgi:2-hydroxychromene-2-carboxylate isomerase